MIIADIKKINSRLLRMNRYIYYKFGLLISFHKQVCLFHFLDIQTAIRRWFRNSERKTKRHTGLRKRKAGEE